MRFKIGLIIAAIAMFAVPAAYADVIVTPSAVIRNDFGEFSSSYPVINMINQSNNNTTFVSGVDDFDAYAATNPTATSNNQPTQFFGQSGNFGPIIDFDLGTEYYIRQLGLFNNQHRGFTDINIYTATMSDFSDATFAGNYTFSITGDADQASPFEVRSLGNNWGRYVRFEVNSFGTDILGGKQVTFGVSQIPEPSTGILAAGGLIGFAAFRRRKKSRQ